MKRIFPEAPLTQNQRNKRHYEKHKDEELQRNRDYHRKNKERIAKRRRLSTHRISQQQHDNLLVQQNNCCAICKQAFIKTPHVDHNHECCKTRITCGKCNRGLLCDNCNLGLGRFKDNIIILSNAIEYVRRYNARR